MGSQCIIAGITPEFAMTAGELTGKNPIFSNEHEGFMHVIEHLQYFFSIISIVLLSYLLLTCYDSNELFLFGM
jgi:hypothetical protein